MNDDDDDNEMNNWIDYFFIWFQNYGLDLVLNDRRR